MKKLLYTLLAVSIIFSACEKEEEEPTNNTNNNNSGNTTNLAIGDTHQGGIIFYLDGNGGGLIAAPSDQGQAEWGCMDILISGADGTAIGTGAQNTLDIEAGCSTPGTAAYICTHLSLGGYVDWFLPSIDELREMYLNRTAIGGGFNGGFTSDYYWSSSEVDVYGAWKQGFDNILNTNQGDKSQDYNNVRAIRSF